MGWGLRGRREQDGSRSGRQLGPGVPPPVCRTVLLGSCPPGGPAHSTERTACGPAASHTAQVLGLPSPQPRGPGLLAATPRRACRVRPSCPVGGGHRRGETWKPGPRLPLPHPCKPGPGWEGWGPQMRPMGHSPNTHTCMCTHTLTHSDTGMHRSTHARTHTLSQIRATSCSPARPR